MSRIEGRNVLVDTSVWFALCLDMDEYADDVRRFLTAAMGKINLLVTTTSLDDLWWSLRVVLRGVVLRRTGTLDKHAEDTIVSIAWDCVEFVRSVATVVATGPLSAASAGPMREFHLGYGQALLITAAEEYRVGCIVSLNTTLQECILTRCLTPAEAVVVYDR